MKMNEYYKIVKWDGQYIQSYTVRGNFYDTVEFEVTDDAAEAFKFNESSVGQTTLLNKIIEGSRIGVFGKVEIIRCLRPKGAGRKHG